VTPPVVVVAPTVAVVVAAWVAVVTDTPFVTAMVVAVVDAVVEERPPAPPVPGLLWQPNVGIADAPATSAHAATIKTAFFIPTSSVSAPGRSWTDAKQERSQSAARAAHRYVSKGVASRARLH
jgi:hypothetical protein